MQSRQSLPSTTDETVDLREYLAVLRRRAPIIVLLTVLFSGLAVGYSVLKTPIYTAQAEVLVNPPAGTLNQNLSQVISMDTEAQVATSAPIAELAAKALGSPLTITQLLKHVSVQTSSTTFVLDISFWDAQPSKAADGANAFAKAYLDYKRQQAEGAISQQQASIESQMVEARRQQREQNQILQTHAPGSVEYRNAQDTLDQLNVRLGVLASELAGVPVVIDPGQVILPATVPASPSSPKYPLNTAVGLFFGLFAGVVVAFLLDRSDDRVHRSSDLQLFLDAPVLAYIPHVKGRQRLRAAQLVVDLEPRSPIAEAYRTIRTNVLSMAHKRDMKTIAVVSPMQQEGKSMTSANLAAALGQTDKRVLVLSVDIRKPRVHEFFGVANDQGLSEILQGEIQLLEAIVKSEVGNVWVLPGGHVPARPAELLQSPAMAQVLVGVREAFDFVILDCPPVLGLADCLAVLPLVDAVLLVVQAGQTRVGAILETCDQLERLGAAVDAAVMNDVRVARGQPGHHGYGYYLASEEYLRSEERDQPRRVPRLVGPRPVEVEDSGNGVGSKGTRGAEVGNGDAADEGLPEPAGGTADEQ